MKILIAGAGGQLGQSLQDTAPAGVEIVAKSSAELDLADLSGLTASLNDIAPDYIFNAAAYTAVDKAEEEKTRADLINGAAVQSLADYARTSGARLVHVSTDFVFDGSSTTPWSVDAATGPLGVYGSSKLLGEQAALSAGDNARTIRTSWVHSEHGNNFVKTMLRLGQTRDELTVVGDQTGSPTYARNLATFMWKFLDTWPNDPVLHFSDAGAITWHEFAVAIFEEGQALGLIDKKPTVHATTAAEYGAPAPRPAYSVLDTSRSEAAFNAAMVPWRDALRDMLKRLPDSKQA